MGRWEGISKEAEGRTKGKRIDGFDIRSVCGGGMGRKEAGRRW